jgi:hypothetical protein
MGKKKKFNLADYMGQPELLTNGYGDTVVSVCRHAIKGELEQYPFVVTIHSKLTIGGFDANCHMADGKYIGEEPGYEDIILKPTAPDA